MIAVLVIALLAAVLAGIYLRNEIVRAWPPARDIYTSIGLPLDDPAPAKPHG